MPYFDDDGNELDPNLVSKPSLCVTCRQNESDDDMEEVLCNLTRLDWNGVDEFICHHYRPQSLL